MPMREVSFPTSYYIYPIQKGFGAGCGSTTYLMALEDKPKSAEAKISWNLYGICDILVDSFKKFG